MSPPETSHYPSSRYRSWKPDLPTEPCETCGGNGDIVGAADGPRPCPCLDCVDGRVSAYSPQIGDVVEYDNNEDPPETFTVAGIHDDGFPTVRDYDGRPDGWVDPAALTLVEPSFDIPERKKP
mgnify:CR=1 FL=1